MAVAGMEVGFEDVVPIRSCAVVSPAKYLISNSDAAPPMVTKTAGLAREFAAKFKVRTGKPTAN